MANRLSDDELRKSLTEYGEDVGPITPTTRSAWERRLTSLRKSKNFSQRKISLNAFSSDDSEIESPSSSAQRRKRTSLSRQDTGERSEKLNLSHPSSLISPLDGETFKKPTSTSSPSFTIQGKKMLLDRSKFTKSVSAKVKRNAGKQAAFDVETSDSDFDTDSSFSLSKSPRRVRRKNNFSTVSTVVTTPHLTEKPINFENSLHRKTVNSTWNSNIESSFQHMNPNANRLKRELNNPDYHSNGYISNTLSNGELSEERLEQGSSTNYSHCISWLLVLGTATFFLFIGAVYVTELQKTTQMASKSYSKFCNGMEEDHCKNLILMSRELHHLLTTVAGIYDCSSETERKKRNLTLSEAKMSMKDFFSTSDSVEMDSFDYIFNQSVLLLRKHPNMGIEFYSSHKEEMNGVEDLSHIDISALEAAQGSKSFWCRIRLSLQWTVAKIVFLIFVAFSVFMCFVFAKMWKRYREAQEKVFYEMVEKVIDILQETANWSTEQDSYKAVVKVRDAIIPPKDRKEKLWLWDRVVAFIEENESRVSVEYRTINGEDFKVWRWQPCTTIENEGSKQGKVWQGQAFSSQGKGKNAMYSLSPCLKIRNMFESEVEYEEGWQTSIEDAILEKCEGNDGIRHIAVDTSTNEGCVYMLCSSTESAGKAFNDLHGWWFDGKLVTVKYIPYKRYLERFPESEHRTEPLRPSNNKRLSLSTPFFSSALERS